MVLLSCLLPCLLPWAGEAEGLPWGEAEGLPWGQASGLSHRLAVDRCLAAVEGGQDEVLGGQIVMAAQ